jgi:hypothetical protein
MTGRVRSTVTLVAIAMVAFVVTVGAITILANLLTR